MLAERKCPRRKTIHVVPVGPFGGPGACMCLGPWPLLILYGHAEKCGCYPNRDIPQLVREAGLPLQFSILVGHLGCLGCSRAKHPSPETNKKSLNSINQFSFFLFVFFSFSQHQCGTQIINRKFTPAHGRPRALRSRDRPV